MPRKAKAQRTDLNATKVTVPGQDYGKQVEQQRAMQSVPMANAFQQSAALQKAAASADVQSSPATQVQEPSAPLTMLHEPTQRPMEPLTHGLPVGPGAGPEALGQTPLSPLAQTLNSIANSPYATPDLLQLAAFAKNQGY